MFSSLLADIVLFIHFGFVLFTMVGGLLVLCRRWIAWLHIPVVLWAVMINLFGWVCPLTPLENTLRIAAGEAGYAGGFVQHYLTPLIYYQGASPQFGIKLGAAVLLWNLALYAWVIIRLRRQHRR